MYKCEKKSLKWIIYAYFQLNTLEICHKTMGIFATNSMLHAHIIDNAIFEPLHRYHRLYSLLTRMHAKRIKTIERRRSLYVQRGVMRHF